MAGVRFDGSLSPRRRQRELTWLLATVALAALFRVGLVLMPRVIRWDEPDYLWLGHSLLAGSGFTISGIPELHYTPLYALLSGTVFWVTGLPELGSDVWFVVCGAAMVLPVYALARRLYGWRTGLIAALLTAIFPALSASILYWGTMTEPLFVLLVYLAAWAMLTALDAESIWAWAVTGGILALAYLCRPEGLVWFAAGGALLILGALLRSRVRFRRLLLSAGLYVVSFALVASPYIVYLWRDTGSPMLTGKLSITHDIGQAVLDRNPVLYDQVTASLDENGEILWWSRDRFEQSIVDVIRQDPSGFVARTRQNVLQARSQLFSSLVFPLFLLAPVILGWFRHPWTTERLRGEAVLWTSALPVLSFLPFHVEVRFFAPAIPALLMWLASGLIETSSWVADTYGRWLRGRRWVIDARWMRWQARALAVLCALVVTFVGVTHVRVVRRGVRDLAFAHKEAGLWLRDHAEPDARVMSRDLAVSLYARRGHVASPRAEYEQWIEYARHKGADYVVVDERELRVLRPHLAFLLDPGNAPADLEAVFEANDRRGATIVYRIEG